MDRNNEGEVVRIPDGELAVIAKYIDQKLPEYNANPLIQALPPILSADEFIDKVTRTPDFDDEERELEARYRFPCIERLSRYFDPQNKTVELQKRICALIMTGYLARNVLKPEYASRSRQIYNAIKDGGGKNLENYVNLPTSASSLTLIGPSGMGKSTNFQNILNLYPSVILHPEHSVYQIVWLKVDCPHAGSLKGLCTDIFLAVDRLLGIALQGEQVNESLVKTNTRKAKLKPKYQGNDIRRIVENAKKEKKPAYEDLKLAGIIKNPVEDFINISLIDA